jgi:hypothetical protein
MLKSNIIAHRGFWKQSQDRNSIVAIKTALEKGFGIETDVRDLNGKLVISHDPPNFGHDFDVDMLADLIVESKSTARVALNVKSDGINQKLKSSLTKKLIDISCTYVFDMSVPDTLAYQTTQYPYYSRISEYETEFSLLNKAEGAWVDNFSGAFDQTAYAEKILKLGKRVGFVSPELHGRNHLGAWEKIKKLHLHRSSSFELCTDFPDEAYKYFGEHA